MVLWGLSLQAPKARGWGSRWEVRGGEPDQRPTRLPGREAVPMRQAASGPLGSAEGLWALKGQDAREGLLSSCGTWLLAPLCLLLAHSGPARPSLSLRPALPCI